MKIKVIMSDKAMSRETMDARERMLKAALSSDAPKIMLIVFLAVITPSASTVTQMCQVYGNDAKYASAINVVTTLCAIVTMPLMVLLFTYIK